MDSVGKHLLVEYYGCDRGLLDDRDAIRTLMRRAATAAGATVVAEVFHPYAPQGVTGVLVIEESHLSIHTWPEYGYAAVDFFTCGDCLPELAHRTLLLGLGAARAEHMQIRRGLRQGPTSMVLESHSGSPLAPLPFVVAAEARFAPADAGAAPEDPA